MTITPGSFKLRNIAVAGRELALAWADGKESYLAFDELRRLCPCSMCRSQREAPSDPLRVVKAPARGEVTIRNLVPVGAYAVQIVWSDGHDLGIYSFEALRQWPSASE
jgi:DUF971 family protein